MKRQGVTAGHSLAGPAADWLPESDYEYSTRLVGPQLAFGLDIYTPSAKFPARTYSDPLGDAYDWLEIKRYHYNWLK